ncbi:tetratricopeptide repeat protein [uncultured Brachyspira sp.]|uniref:tetratricopeptide repeat protein n=1 Tax=uncultured Brachyspira sp. TaxID=221953 RepID=UPI002624F4E5|nr:tetratricopeptide repeat protein [uncultured Brachyspira sp.]
MNIIEQINELHENDEHEKIIEIIISIPSEERNSEILSLLARAYNNVEKYDEALDNLMYIREEGIDDALWNYRVGYAYYYKGDKEIAENYFKKAYDLNNEDIDAYNFYMLCSEDIDDGINFEERVNRFWKWFEENEKVISDFIDKKSDMTSEEIVEFVSDGAALISNNLQFNFGGDYEFTFTVEGKEYLFYLTPRVVSAMPEKLKSKWKFFPYIPKQDITNSNFKMYNKDLSFKEILVYAEYDDNTNFFNLKFYNKKLNELEEDYAYNAFYIMLEHAVGENILKLYLLGNIEKSDKRLDNMIELTKLYDFITDTLKSKNKDIVIDPINKYTVYECKPTDNFFREDIFIGNTCYMELISDYANYNVDAVVNISKMGARAVYLAYVFADNEENGFNDENINKKLLDERNKITDELENIMGKKESGKEIGIILGNAFGVVGGYIDLLLYNQDEFIKRAEEVLRNYNYKFRLLRFRQYSEIIKTFNE